MEIHVVEPPAWRIVQNPEYSSLVILFKENNVKITFYSFSRVRFYDLR
jgi:hypothetical protein